jgi:hypothetical protein
MVKKTLGTVGGPCFLIGVLAFTVSLVLGLLKFLDQLDAWILLKISVLGIPRYEISYVVLIIVTTVISYGVSLSMLSSPMMWRRVVIWLCAMLLIVSSVPVLALIRLSFSLSVPLTACFWSGFCALVYASRHTMPCESYEIDKKVTNVKAMEDYSLNHENTFISSVDEIVSQYAMRNQKILEDHEKN